jgi:hypothetical protein
MWEGKEPVRYALYTAFRLNLGKLVCLGIRSIYVQLSRSGLSTLGQINQLGKHATVKARFKAAELLTSANILRMAVRSELYLPTAVPHQ